MMKHLKSHFNLARTATTLLAVICSVWSWAGNISDEQALQLAQQFVNRHATAAGPHRAPAAQQVTAVGQVCGLYVFNVADDGGFVIVSNDDRTMPILGYSDSGSLDTQNIPSNMRAWLQVYADEIAWVQAQATQTIQLSAPLRVNNRQNKGPLLTTTWNQGAPYNNQTPYYRGSGSSVQYSYYNQNGYSHCATGCGATALAQVMNYHKYPTSVESIPGYTWESAGITLSGLGGVRFDWSNMLNSYSNSYNSTEANAVATLMKYCGWATEMDYGPESGTSTYNLLNALTTYFGYNSTTQVALRNYYTYDNWVALIYNEINQDRPVLIAGQSKGGGHEFVCDGYQNRDGTDYFHINWGWGGLSDEYFLLSALKPDVQGTGGSLDLGDGFNSSVEAIVGIQKPDDTGTVAINQRDFSKELVLKNMTTDHSSINLGSSINITLSIYNDSDEDFEGIISAGRKKDGSAFSIKSGKFSIPARETSDCTLSYTPDELGTYDLLFFYPTGFGTAYTNTTVYASFIVVSVGAPTDLTVSEITGRDALLEWTNNNGASQWVVAYKAKGDDRFTENSFNGSSSYELTNLTPETTYTAKVRPANGNDLWSEEITFTTAEAYPAPEELAVTDISHDYAKATWTGDADSYVVRYGKVIGQLFTTEDEWLQYDNQRVQSYTNLGLEKTTWGVMYPGEKVTGSVLTNVAFFEYAGYNTKDITVNIYSGGDNAPGTLLHTQVVTPTGNSEFHVIEFDEPVAITPGENLWITLTEEGLPERNNLVIFNSLIDDNDPNSQWILYNGQWYQLRNKFTADDIEKRCWLIRACMEIESYNFDAVDWLGDGEDGKAVDGTSCELTGLEPNWEHVVQVKGKYSDGGESKWATTTFTTQDIILAQDNSDNNSGALSEGQELSVQLLGRTLYKDGAWNTICLPFDLTLQGSPLEGAEAKTLANATMTGTHVTLTFSDAVEVLQAGVPYIIKWDDGENIVQPVFRNVTITSTEGQTITKADGNVKFIGYYDAFNISANDADIYYMTADNALKRTGKDRKLNAFRAYFKFSEAASARSFVLDFGDMTTEIGAIENGTPDVGNKTGEWYSVDGVKHGQQPTRKGVYVKDGKKLVVK